MWGQINYLKQIVKIRHLILNNVVIVKWLKANEWAIYVIYKV